VWLPDATLAPSLRWFSFLPVFGQTHRPPPPRTQFTPLHQTPTAATPEKHKRRAFLGLVEERIRPLLLWRVSPGSDLIVRQRLKGKEVNEHVLSLSVVDHWMS
jgi:hypothetical protein